MYSGLVAAVVLSFSVIFFLIYKRKMLVKLFSLDIAGQVDTFEKDIQNTADVAVTKITSASGNLEQLLEDAQETIEELKIRVKIAEEQLYKASVNEVKQNVIHKNIHEEKAKFKPTFAEQLIKASYQTAVHLDEEDEKPVKIRKSQPAIEKQTAQLVVELEQISKDESNTSISDNYEEVVKEKEVLPEDNIIDFPQIDMRGAEPKFKQKQILRLAANGYDDVSIAKTLKLGVGEVKLTRKLSQK